VIFDELKRLQEELARKIVLKPLERLPEIVAGADVSYARKEKRSYGVLAVLRLPELEEVDQAVAEEETPFPYVPGFLSFREVPVLKKAFARLKRRPEVLLVDGQGILHPRGLGLASHLGLELGIPTIGVAKKPLCGEFDWPADRAGAWKPIYLEGEVKGAVLRTRKGVKPVFVSPGHLVDLESALEVVQRCLVGYRLPEPIRKAHLLSQRVKK